MCQCICYTAKGSFRVTLWHTSMADRQRLQLIDHSIRSRVERPSAIVPIIVNVKILSHSVSFCLIPLNPEALTLGKKSESLHNALSLPNCYMARNDVPTQLLTLLRKASMHAVGSVSTTSKPVYVPQHLQHDDVGLKGLETLCRDRRAFPLNCSINQGFQDMYAGISTT